MSLLPEDPLSLLEPASLLNPPKSRKASFSSRSFDNMGINSTSPVITGTRGQRNLLYGITRDRQRAMLESIGKKHLSFKFTIVLTNE